MLIVMVNKERTRFALEFAKNIIPETLGLVFNCPTSKYKDIMFTDEKEFLKRIIELISKSIDYSGFLSSETVTIEYNSSLRLEDWCKPRGHNYRRNITNGTTIDVFINDIPIQAKYVSKNQSSGITYQIKILNREEGLKVRDSK
jgi:hypothetical protein